MTSPADDLASLLDHAAVGLLALDPAATTTPLRPGGWSRRQLLGHLLDSAIVNHARIVRATLEDGLVLPGYDQDGWVRVQGYDAVAWPDLIAHWRAANRHLVHVLRRVLPAARAHRVTVGSDPVTTLDGVAASYVAHLRHHLAQLLG